MPHASHSPRSSEKRLAASKETLATILQQIEDREGATKQDVRYLVSATSKPDGISRQIVTWFTRAQEPEFFAAEAHHRELRSMRQSALRAFIDGLP